eukprot:Gb_40746 [translate_table: standard]
MASSLDRVSSESFGSRRRHVVIIQKNRKISVVRPKKKGQANYPKSAGFQKTVESFLDFTAVKSLILLVSNYIARLLLHSTRRRTLRLKCMARLQLQRQAEFFDFADQAVLSDLYWGVESLEKAIRSRSVEAKNARLDNAERMLQVPAFVDEDATTAGISNTYLISCAYFYLALVWKLRRNDCQMTLHLLQAFVVSPYYSRLDFAPDLWKQLFLPHVTAPEGWYQNQFASVMENPEGLLPPEELHLKQSQRKELELLRMHYEDALDKTTREHAKHYKDWLMYYTVVSTGEDAEDKMKYEISSPNLVQKWDILDRDTQRNGRLQKESCRVHVPLRKFLRDAIFGTNYTSDPSKQKHFLQHVNKEDEQIQVEMACLPDLSANESLLWSDGRGTSGKVSTIYNEKQDGGKQSPMLQEENCKASIRKSSVVRRLTFKKTVDPKRLSDMLREPQSDMSTCADSHFSSTDENTDSEGNELEVETTAWTSSTDTLMPVPMEGTGLVSHSGRSYEKHNGTSTLKQMSPIKAVDNACSTINPLFTDSITVDTGEAYKDNIILQDQYSCEKVSSLTEKYFDQSTIVHVARQLLDHYKLERLASFQQNKCLPLDFEEQPMAHDKTPLCIGDTCFDDHLSESLRRSRIAEVNQAGNSVRRKLDFSDNTKGYQKVNLDVHTDCQAFEEENKFEQAVSILCTSDELSKCEDAVLAIIHMWPDLESRAEAESILLRGAVIDQLIEVLLASKIKEVLRASVCILSAMIIKNKFTVHHIMNTDPELYSVTGVLKRRRISEAAVLLYLLKPSAVQMKTLELLPILVEVLYNGNHYIDGPISLPWTSSAVAVMMIEMLVGAFDNLTNESHLKVIISLKALPGLVNILKSNDMEERVAAAFILIKCMRSVGTCRQYISQNTSMVSIVQLLHSGSGRCRSVAVEFIAEVICLPRKSSIVNVLRQIQGDGVFNSMHILMDYIQKVPLEHQPLAAGILLQLDMLAESQGQSIFREEALEVILAALSSEESINAQISSASVLSNLGGHFTCTGEPSTVAWLLKKAGLSSTYCKLVTGDMGSLNQSLQEEDDTGSWSTKIAKTVMISGRPVFETLKRGLQSKVSEVARNCLIAVAWLGCELTAIHRNRLRHVACDIILPEIIGFMQPGREIEERVLASLSLYNYTAGPGMQKLTEFSEELHGSLRRLSALTWTAEELLKVITYSSPSELKSLCKIVAPIPKWNSS